MSKENYTHDVFANCIMYILKHDTITSGDLVSRFKLSIEAVSNIIGTMELSNVISKEDENGNHTVLVKCADDLNEGILWFLREHGFSNEEIVSAFYALKTEDKTEISKILMEERNWMDANENKPDLDTAVVIRIVDKNKIYYEDRTEVMYVEDIKIASWDGYNWYICPPFPKYDYSPLSDHFEINDGAIVTHWATPEEGEVNAWYTRFDRIDNYHLNIDVDPEHEEEVYRALLLGATYIAKFGGVEFTECPENAGLKSAYNTLYEMLSCFNNEHDKQNLHPIRKGGDK